MKTILALAFALTAATASAKSFLIERIDVNAVKRIPAAAVIAETRLDAGKTYTEEQLEQALDRVRRLPFVLFASADLKEGSTPDARVLRINIEETSRFNWAIDSSGVALDHGSHGTVNGNARYTFFPGEHGTLEASYGENNTSYIGTGNTRTATLAYNGYGLFGTRMYGGVAVGTVLSSNGRHDINPALLLGVPLTRTQSIEATASRATTRLERSVTGLADPVRSSTRFTDAALTWLYQTADDPYFARNGLDVAAGPSWEREELDLPFVLTYPTIQVVPGLQTQRHMMFHASAAKYLPLGPSSVMWGRAAASRTHITGEVSGVPFDAASQREGDVLFGVAYNFGHNLGESGQGRTRLEFGAGYHVDNIPGRKSLNNDGPELNFGLLFRNRYGLLRLSLSWVEH